MKELLWIPSNLNPGATVQPTKLKADPSLVNEPNLQDNFKKKAKSTS